MELDAETPGSEATPPTSPFLELKSERVQRELASLRGWQANDQGAGLELHLRFPSLELAYAFVATFVEIAAEEALPNPQLVLIGQAVGITLVHPNGSGIAPRQLQVARALAVHPAGLAGQPLADFQAPSRCAP